MPAILGYHEQHRGTIRFKKFEFITENILHQKYDAACKASLSQRFSDYVLARMADCSFVPGALEFLEYFYKKFPMFLVSANPPQDLEEVLRLRNIAHYFNKTYATDEKAQAIGDILKGHQWQGKDAVFIGDSWLDYQASREEHVTFLGRDSGSFKGVSDFKVFADMLSIQQYLCV